MKKNNGKLAYALLALLSFALLSSSLVVNVHAASPWQSSNVLIVNQYVTYGYNPGYCASGGGLYTGPNFPNGDSFTFTGITPSTMADGTIPNPIAGNDTVVLMLPGTNFASYWSDSDFSSRITNFVNAGGKLIIYDSESNQNTAYSSFIYPFQINSPGAQGSGSGSIENLVNDTLSSDNPADASYIEIQALPGVTDAIGDSNVMISNSSDWLIDMTTRNVNNVVGPVHTYAFYGAGLMIWNGLDVDYGGYTLEPTNDGSAGAVLEMIWWRELCAQSFSGPVPSLTGLSLSPKTALNAVGTTHTVIALTTNQSLAPVSGVAVNFTILSGPNAGMTSVAVTDASGEATFSWSSAAEGTDTVMAWITNEAGAKVNDTATKTWYLTPNNVIPEVPLGTLAAFAVMFVGLASFAAKGKIRKSLKLQK